jgi:H+/gluconate symporter-like permease
VSLHYLLTIERWTFGGSTAPSSAQPTASSTQAHRAADLDMNTPLLLGLLTAIVTIVGWFVAYFTTRWREDRTRRLEASIKYRMAQIEQFYDPLFNLVNQIFVANHIQYDLLDA